MDTVSVTDSSSFVAWPCSPPVAAAPAVRRWAECAHDTVSLWAAAGGPKRTQCERWKAQQGNERL